MYRILRHIQLLSHLEVFDEHVSLSRQTCCACEPSIARFYCKCLNGYCNYGILPEC